MKRCLIALAMILNQQSSGRAEMGFLPDPSLQKPLTMTDNIMSPYLAADKKRILNKVDAQEPLKACFGLGGVEGQLEIFRNHLDPQVNETIGLNQEIDILKQQMSTTARAYCGFWSPGAADAITPSEFVVGLVGVRNRLRDLDKQTKTLKLKSRQGPEYWARRVAEDLHLSRKSLVDAGGERKAAFDDPDSARKVCYRLGGVLVSTMGALLAQPGGAVSPTNGACNASILRVTTTLEKSVNGLCFHLQTDRDISGGEITDGLVATVDEALSQTKLISPSCRAR